MDTYGYKPHRRLAQYRLQNLRQSNGCSQSRVSTHYGLGFQKSPSYTSRISTNCSAEPSFFLKSGRDHRHCIREDSGKLMANISRKNFR